MFLTCSAPYYFLVVVFCCLDKIVLIYYLLPICCRLHMIKSHFRSIWIEIDLLWIFLVTRWCRTFNRFLEILNTESTVCNIYKFLNVKKYVSKNLIRCHDLFHLFDKKVSKAAEASEATLNEQWTITVSCFIRYGCLSGYNACKMGNYILLNLLQVHDQIFLKEWE